MSISEIGFIGAGKVGFSLGKLFAERGVRVTGYYSRHQESAREAALFTGTKQYSDMKDLIRDSEAIFLTVPDGEILPVYRSLENSEIADKSICHCSGALTVSETFPDIDSHGAQGHAIHPLFPFSDKFTAYKGLADAFFCIEDRSGAARWEEFLSGLGLKTKIISPRQKARYHAACCAASNLVCALAEISAGLLETCGFSEREALDALAPLMRNNLENIIRSGPAGALTGPVERCDVSTVEKHLACFTDPREKELYRLASLILTGLAGQKNSGRDYSPLRSLLEKENENV